MGRDTHMFGVCAVAVGNGPIQAHLCPAGLTVLAMAAAVIVMIHDPITDLGLGVANRGADGDDCAAGFVPGDYRAFNLLGSDTNLTRWASVGAKICSAHA